MATPDPREAQSGHQTALDQHQVEVWCNDHHDELGDELYRVIVRANWIDCREFFLEELEALVTRERVAERMQKGAGRVQRQTHSRHNVGRVSSPNRARQGKSKAGHAKPSRLR